MVSPFRDRARGWSGRAKQLARFACLSLVTSTFCLAAFLVSSNSHAIADDVAPKSQAERLRSKVLRIPELLKSGRKAATRTATQKPTVARDRFVSRTIQLLAEARRLEKSGKAEAALEMALRAQSVLKTAQQTTGTSWPDGEESPEEYITAMKRRTGATGRKQRTGTESGRQEFVPGRRLPHPKPASPTPPSVKSDSVPSQRTLAGTAGSANTNEKLLLDWGSNNLPFTGIALTAGTQQQQVEAARLPRTDNSADSASDVDEARLLLQQLGKLELWTSSEEVGSEEPGSKSKPAVSVKPPAQDDSDHADKESAPLVIPGLIDRPDGIDDQNVGPIPTHPAESVSGSPSEAVTTTIPVVPNPDDIPPAPGTRSQTNTSQVAKTDTSNTTTEPSVYSASPQLLVNTEDVAAENEATVWQLAAAQLLSTFLGVVFAVAAFLAIRAVASRLFGTHLGVTFQFGSGSKSTTPAIADAPVDVVPFSSQDDQPRRAGGVANPEDFPFRIVGSSTGEDEHLSEQQAEQDRDGAILKTVFEHNVQLQQEIDHTNESAA